MDTARPRRDREGSFMKIIKLPLLCLTLALLSCGPAVVSNPNLAKKQIVKVALLPVTFETETSRERVLALDNLLRAELEGSGFQVLERANSEKMCSEGGCSKDPEKLADLFGQYQLDSAIAVRLRAPTSANILVGNFYRLSATLDLLDTRGEILLKVQYAESEKGGLIFNSGQIVEGLRTTQLSGDKSKFSRVAGQLAKELVLALKKEIAAQSQVVDQRAPLSSVAGQRTPTIDRVELRPAKLKGSYRLCADGTSNSGASAKLGKESFDLRETASGKYCAVFPLGWILGAGEQISVTFRSPFGEISTRNVDGKLLGLCDPKVGVQYDALRGTLSRSCNGAQCFGELASCRDSSFVVYSASEPSGNFRRLGEVPVRGTLTLNSKGGASIFAVVAVSKSGAISTPTIYSPKGSD